MDNVDNQSDEGVQAKGAGQPHGNKVMSDKPTQTQKGKSVKTLDKMTTRELADKVARLDKQIASRV
ncbi:hypothetical protein [Helicobacter sp. L8]|uniref:hypothetical protein n=1 Tax=Helicobacter sp. L8 TaxID=2316078 RepID=UPI000EB462F8|nr:hypothetical protein [Helicobacter sp. L8]